MGLSEWIEILEASIHQAPESNNLKNGIITAGLSSFTQGLLFLRDQELDDPTLVIKLTEFLKSYWIQYQSSPLSYTSIPQHVISQVAVLIAIWIMEHSAEPKPNPLSLLMPNLRLESIVDEYPDLLSPNANQIEWLQEILATHIVSSDGKNLIPVTILTTLPDTPGDFKLKNPYADSMSTNEDQFYINKDEFNRLIKHSVATRAIGDAKTRIDLLARSENHLLAHLYQLERLLKIYSVRGVGTEENAAGNVYAAIIGFNEYYQKLTSEMKAAIPLSVKNEIDLLINLSTNKDQNTNATQQMETCIATRRDELVKAIIGQENILSTIDITEKQQESFLTQTQEEFNAAKKALEEAITTQNYDKDAKDNHTLTVNLLHNLHVNLSIQTEQDMDFFGTLSPAEINEFLQDEQIRKQLHAYLTHQNLTVEHLALLFINLTTEQIEAFLNSMAPLLADNIQSRFASLLISLPPEKCAVVCLALQDKIRDWIKSVQSFQILLLELSPEQCTAVCMAVKKTTSDWIKNAKDFKNLLHFLIPKQCTSVCVALKDLIPTWIETKGDLKEVLSSLRPSQCTAVCSVLKDIASNWIKTAADFKEMISSLNLEQRIAVCNALEKQMPDLIPIKTREDFQHLLQHVSCFEYPSVYTILSSKLNLVINANNLGEQLFIYSDNAAERISNYNQLKTLLLGHKKSEILNSEIYDELQFYIEEKLTQKKHTIGYFKKPLKKDVLSKANAAIWFQTIIGGGEFSLSDYNSHKLALNDGKLGNIVKKHELFNQKITGLEKTGNGSITDDLQKTKEAEAIRSLASQRPRG